MGKNRLLLLPFFVGLVLMIYSWYLTYPLPTISANDFLFNHISILYWFSLPLLLASMFLMAVTTKSNLLKWIFIIGIVLTWFSLSFFHYMMPTSDSEYIRGLTEYFIKTKSLDPSQPNHNYYQWPAFFILADIVTSISGLSLANYEFLLYTIIGFFLATALFVYGSKKFTNGGILTVVAFFISITSFINYQSVPFSLALGILFLLFMLGDHQNGNSSMVIMLVFYASLLITHLYVPMFFILYLLGRSLLDRNRLNRGRYRNLFLFALVSYFLVQITLARFSFEIVTLSFTRVPIENYSSAVSNTLVSSSIPYSIGAIAQFFSRTVTIASIGLCVAGLILILIKRKLNAIDKAILFAGLVYSGLGAVLNTLGWRAISVAFLPFSLGAAFLLKSKFKRVVIGIFLVLLMLAFFVPLHQSLNETTFQTEETYIANNFFIDHYNLGKSDFVVADIASISYLTTKLSFYVLLHQSLNIGDKPDVILYSPEFIGELGNYSSMERLSQGERLDLLYNDGSFCTYISPSSK